MGLDALELRIIETVERCGWMVLEVNPLESNPDPQPFAYTIGLAVTYGWPELICFGLLPEDDRKLLNNAVGEIKQKGLIPSSGLELREVLEGFPTRLEIFPRKFFINHLDCATWFAHHRGMKPKQFDCLQLVWCDKNGLFPSDPTCDPIVRKLQTPRSRVLQ